MSTGDNAQPGTLRRGDIVQLDAFHPQASIHGRQMWSLEQHFGLTPKKWTLGIDKLGVSIMIRQMKNYDEEFKKSSVELCSLIRTRVKNSSRET